MLCSPKNGSEYLYTNATVDMKWREFGLVHFFDFAERPIKKVSKPKVPS